MSIPSAQSTSRCLHSDGRIRTTPQTRRQSRGATSQWIQNQRSSEEKVQGLLLRGPSGETLRDVQVARKTQANVDEEVREELVDPDRCHSVQGAAVVDLCIT